MSETQTEVWRSKDGGGPFLPRCCSTWPFLTLFLPVSILLPLRACAAALCFAVLSLWQAMTFCRVNPFGTVFPTAQAIPFPKIHLSLPATKLPTQMMCVTCRSAPVPDHEQLCCCLSGTLARQCGHWQCRQEVQLGSLLMTELHCRLFSHTCAAPFAPLLNDHSCRRQRLDPECLVRSSDMSQHYQKPLIVINIPAEVCCDPSGMHCLPKLLME